MWAFTVHSATVFMPLEAKSISDPDLPSRSGNEPLRTAFFGIPREELLPWEILLLVSAGLVWGYWNSLVSVARRWEDPLYSHGYLVPVFALVLLWMRKKPIQMASAGESWAGLGLLSAGLAMRLVATHFALITPEMVSFLPSLAGVFLLVGGWSLLRWAGPAIAFLIFMYPLPMAVKEKILLPLQYLATETSTFVLQTIGVAAYCEGNRITVGEMQMGVVDACSGLRMSTNLLALVVAILLVTERPWWERLIVLASAVPLALTVNVARIVMTALVHVNAQSPAITDRFHDWAGLAMMPLALGLLVLELWILSRLVIEEDGSQLAAAGLGLPTAKSC